MSKTRTWFSLPDQTYSRSQGSGTIPTNGSLHSMVMTEACVLVADVHDRMRGVLQQDDWSPRLDGSPVEARALCQPYPVAMTVDRTTARPRPGTVGDGVGRAYTNLH